MISAIIPAAGLSTRMGRPKLTLPFGDGTVIGRVIAALRAGGVDAVLVVTGVHAPEVAELSRAAGAEALVLERPTRDMRETVFAGLRWAEEQTSPGAGDAWFLAPGDQPTLSPAIIRDLIAYWHSSDRRASIVVPNHDGERGHPTLIGWQHVKPMREMPSDVGINWYLRRHEDETFELPVDAPAVLDDMDTPEDYARLNGDSGLN